MSGGQGLAFESVALELGDRTVLRDVSFTVEPGEVVGLLGRNGAGKTSLLRLATRLLEPGAGRVTFAGQPLSSYSRRQLARRIATVPQDLHVPFPFLAGEIVLMGRAPHQGLLGFESSEDLSLAQEAMERMGIASLANRSIFELSGGERQLVLFARAMVQRPEVLLLDEPTAFLDLRHRIDVLSVVRELASEGHGALVISHDLGLAARICDRLVVLGDGVVLAQGPPHEVVRPDVLADAFAIEADVVLAPDGDPLVVPKMPPRPARRR
jgi:iron complex transport system ATP-binding protein